MFLDLLRLNRAVGKAVWRNTAPASPTAPAAIPTAPASDHRTGA